MKILQIHKYFHIKGGASRYFFEVSKLLEKKGHEVAFFSMHDPQNQKSRWSKYFVKNISYDKVAFASGFAKFAHMVYSIEARDQISRLLDDYRPDVAHIHSIYHHISPSIILELRRRGIPMVQTLHDYHLIAPSHTLFHDGNICEVTKKRSYYKSIFHRCIKKSYWASIAETIEQYIHSLAGIYMKNIDMFIAPSNFLAQKIESYGIPKNKIIMLNNFCEVRRNGLDDKQDDYVLYFGRLSPEKGLEMLIKTAALLPSIPFKIVGDGPQKEGLKKLINTLGTTNVELCGQQTGLELHNSISASRFVILPSQSYEIFPMSVIEAFSLGKPVVASDLGGLPELVHEGYNGLLFKSNCIGDCSKKIKMLWENVSSTKKFGENARKYVENNLDAEKHYVELLKIYKKAIKTHLSSST